MPEPSQVVWVWRESKTRAGASLNPHDAPKGRPPVAVPFKLYKAFVMCKLGDYKFVNAASGVPTLAGTFGAHWLDFVPEDPSAEEILFLKRQGMYKEVVLSRV